jgi:hypothetical protein
VLGNTDFLFRATTMLLNSVVTVNVSISGDMLILLIPLIITITKKDREIFPPPRT